MWFTCDLHVIYMWLTCYLHVTYMCLTCGLHVTYMWITCDLHVTYMWLTCVSHVTYMWLTCDLHVNYMWLTCDLHIRFILYDDTLRLSASHFSAMRFIDAQNKSNNIIVCEYTNTPSDKHTMQIKLNCDQPPPPPPRNDHHLSEGVRSAWPSAKLTSLYWFQPWLDETDINVIT